MTRVVASRQCFDCVGSSLIVQVFASHAPTSIAIADRRMFAAYICGPVDSEVIVQNLGHWFGRRIVVKLCFANTRSYYDTPFLSGGQLACTTIRN